MKNHQRVTHPSCFILLDVTNLGLAVVTMAMSKHSFGIKSEKMKSEKTRSQPDFKKPPHHNDA